MDARRRRLLLHVAPRRPEDPRRRPPGLRRGPLPQARDRSEDGRRRPREAPATRRRSSARASRATATGSSSSSQHGWTSDRRLRSGTSQTAARRRPWTPLAVGIKAHFDVEAFGRTASSSRPTTARRTAASSRSTRRSPSAPRGRRSSPSARTPTLAGLRHRRRPARARLPEERHEPPRDPRARRQARARGRRCPASGTVGGPSRARRRGRGVLLVHVVHDAGDDLPDVGEDGRDVALLPGQGAGRPLAVHRVSRCSIPRRTGRASRCSSCTART